MLFDLSSIHSVLCLGAHADDIEIGCGGMLLNLLAAKPSISMHWAVFSSDAVRRGEAEESFRAWTTSNLHSQLHTFDFTDTRFPWQGAELKDAMQNLAKVVRPDLILTHCRHDLHQDHRAIQEFTWHTFRQHLILEYEIPKYEGDLGQPNLFFELSPEIVERKISLLLEHFKTQREKPWFDDELFRGLMRLRGAETPGPARYAEAFHASKINFTFPAT